MWIIDHELHATWTEQTTYQDRSSHKRSCCRRNWFEMSRLFEILRLWDIKTKQYEKPTEIWKMCIWFWRSNPLAVFNKNSDLKKKSTIFWDIVDLMNQSPQRKKIPTDLEYCVHQEEKVKEWVQILTTQQPQGANKHNRESSHDDCQCWVELRT